MRTQPTLQKCISISRNLLVSPKSQIQRLIIMKVICEPILEAFSRRNNSCLWPIKPARTSFCVQSSSCGPGSNIHNQRQGLQQVSGALEVRSSGLWALLRTVKKKVTLLASTKLFLTDGPVCRVCGCYHPCCPFVTTSWRLVSFFLTCLGQPSLSCGVGIGAGFRVLGSFFPAAPSCVHSRVFCLRLFGGIGLGSCFRFAAPCGVQGRAFLPSAL